MDLQKEIKQSGYAVIKHGDLANPDESLAAVIASIAQPIAYLGLPLVMDLKPQSGFQPTSYAGTGVFDLHTDLTWHEKPAKYLGIFCVGLESAGGGIPLLADGWKALADLDKADLDFLKTESVTFEPPSHITYPSLRDRIITENQDEIMVRFRYDMLEDPAPPVTRYYQSINRHVIHLDLSPGDIYVVDNERMLHGRTSLKAGLTSDRHLKRMYGDI